MTEKSDIEEPPQIPPATNSLVKNFFKKFLNKANIYLAPKINSSTSSEVTQNTFIKNFESFTQKTAQDVMIPRADIIAVKYDISLQDLSKVIIKYAHTRILVYKENLDNIIGFVHIKDLFEIIAKAKKYNLKKLLRKHIVSAPSMEIVDLLKQMQLHRTHIAVVVDEYGGTDGIVTIEDIIEAIVGPIDDEHDTNLEIENFKVIKPGIVIANARLEIEKLEEILAVKLREEDDEFDTIGGLVLAKVGNVPEKGQVINITDKVIVEIMSSTPRTIKQLKITYSKE